MLVTQRQFEDRVESAMNQIESANEGLHGPRSMTWRIGREAMTFLAGGSAALLQLAHPYVAHGVDQHSETRRDPIGRFNRTFLHVYNMIFGTREDALDSARRVREIHDQVHGPIAETVGRFRAGDRYRAHDHDALFWVHATLVYSAVQTYELVIAPLTLADKDAYYAEMLRFAALFGIDPAYAPPDWNRFEAYFDDMVHSDTIRVGAAAQELSHFLMTPPSKASGPFFDWYMLMTAGLLPQTLRAQFGFRYGPEHERTFDRSVASLRLTRRILPPRLRYVPAYFEAKRRLAGKSGPDVVGRAMEATVLKVLAPGAAANAKAASRCPVA